MNDVVRILKVDHAGEHGAVSIYRGQLMIARWRAPELVPQLLEFRRHEERHRQIFQGELIRRGARRRRSYHLCGLGGSLLGLRTGLCGRSAIAATTVAVERVVLKHLEEQLTHLKSEDAEAHAAVASIYDDELEHHDTAEHDVEPGGFWFRLLSPIVGTSTEAVIWLGMRI